MKRFVLKPQLALLVIALLLAAALLAGCQAAETPAATPDAIPTSPPAAQEPPDNGYPLPGAPQEGPGQPDTSFWLAYPPVPGDETLERGNFFLDAAQITPLEGTPGSFQLDVEGSLPTPCHQPRVEINPPNEENQIRVEIYSLVDANTICTQVIQPFIGTVATLSGYPPGNYTLIVNELNAGQMSIP